MLNNENIVRVYQRARDAGYKLRANRALTKLLARNDRLIHKIAQRVDIPHGYYEDAVQAGRLGMIHAADLFDAERQHRFITYAYAWVHNYMVRESRDRSGALRLPPHIWERRTPENGALISAAKNAGSVGEFDPDEMAYEVVAPDNVEAEVEIALMRENLVQLCADAHLTPKEYRVIKLRYLSGDVVVPLRALEEPMGITRQRIKQLEDSAILKLATCARREEKLG